MSRSFAQMHEDHLDPDLHLWNEEYIQLRCKCGCFLPEQESMIEHVTQTRHFPAGETIDDEPFEDTQCWTTTYHYCKRCKREHPVPRA